MFTSLKGKEILTTFFRRHVIKSAGDLIHKCDPTSFKQYRFEATEIKNLTKQRNEKMARLQEEGFDENEFLNAKKENNKLKDFTYLKNEISLAPFSKVEEMQNFVSLPIDETENNKGKYVEILYAGVTSITQNEIVRKNMRTIWSKTWMILKVLLL